MSVCQCGDVEPTAGCDRGQSQRTLSGSPFLARPREEMVSICLCRVEFLFNTGRRSVFCGSFHDEFSRVVLSQPPGGESRRLGDPATHERENISNSQVLVSRQAAAGPVVSGFRSAFHLTNVQRTLFFVVFPGGQWGIEGAAAR